MSKMPAKKKSCFQITSVTPAQVAASSMTDDTESLDDPDESRTEDVSSEIFDVSRADFEPEACDRSSSEETLNNVGETEAPGAIQPRVPHDGQLPAAPGPVNGGFGLRGATLAGVSQHVSGTLGATGQPPALVQQASVSAVGAAASQPLPATAVCSSAATSTAGCSSRFRVIKLDHGTGEPFRRGRWTCTDYYDKDSEGAVSIRHASIAEQSMDRDSGLGATAGSIVLPGVTSGPGPESSADSSFSPPTPLHPAEPFVQLPQGYGLHPAAGGSTAQGAFQPSVYSTAPVVPQNLLPPGHNSIPLSVPIQHAHKSPSMPSASQTQPFAYGGQLPSAHHLPSQPTGPSDYRQSQLPLLQAVGTGVSSQALATGTVGGKGPSPAVTPGAQPLGAAGQQVEPMGLVQQPKPGSQYQASGGSPVSSSSPLVMSNQMLSMSGQPHTPGPFCATSAEDSRRKSEVLPQVSVTPGKDAAKPLNAEGLPPVNSLFNIPIAMDDDDDGSSGASVVAIDNKIEQAMDLVKSHLMYAVREEVEVLKEQIKELYERNSVLERENAVLKSLANSDQLSQLSQAAVSGGNTPPQLQQHPVAQAAAPQPQEAGHAPAPQHNASSV